MARDTGKPWTPSDIQTLTTLAAINTPTPTPTVRFVGMLLGGAGGGWLGRRLGELLVDE